jgi:hypothetical protein
MSPFRVIDATSIRQDATWGRISSPFFVSAPSISGVEAGPSRECFQDGGLGGFKDAIQAAQDPEWQDDLAVIGLFVIAPEQVGNGPDESSVRRKVDGWHELKRTDRQQKPKRPAAWDARFILIQIKPLRWDPHFTRPDLFG